MSEDGEMWAEIKEQGRQKRWRNAEWSIAFLVKQGVKVECLNEGQAHYRVGDWSFWPTTGKYYNPKTGKSGRGVRNLLKEITWRNKDTSA